MNASSRLKIYKVSKDFWRVLYVGTNEIVPAYCIELPKFIVKSHILMQKSH